MIYLEVPKKLRMLVDQARQTAEHEYPVELDMFAAIMDGTNDALENGGAGSGKLRQGTRDSSQIQNGINMTTVLGLAELCRGDVGLSLTTTSRFS
jgi:acyl-CoA dehydrogenase